MRSPQAILFLLCPVTWLAIASSVSATDVSADRGATWLITRPDELRSPPPPADATDETRQLKDLAANRTQADLDRILWWDVGGPAYRWNQIAIDEMLSQGVTVPLALRHLALLHAAMHDAVAAAWDSKKAYVRKRPSQLDASVIADLPVPVSPSYPSDYAAAATAASEVLAYIFPDRAETLRGRAAEAIRTRQAAGIEFPSDAAAGREIGNRVAAKAIEYGKLDGSDRKWTGTVPEGPGKWKGTKPINPAAATWKTWVLASPDALRPPSPPAWDSPQLKAELDELEAFKRTPQTDSIALFWETFGGRRAFALWNDQASRKILEYDLGTDPPSATRALAILNIAMYDAIVACWDAKYAYWQIRPSQLEPEFKPLFPPPNHPSYPAAHGCLSTAAATALARLFPRDAEALLALGKQAAEARIWAGIHYRSDIDAGQTLGRAVADQVVARALGSAN